VHDVAGMAEWVTNKLFFGRVFILDFRGCSKSPLLITKQIRSRLDIEYGIQPELPVLT
jgi:hypothetical protein